MLATQSLTFNHPMLLDGISYVRNGVEDGLAIQGSEIARFNFDNEVWVIESTLDLP